MSRTYRRKNYEDTKRTSWDNRGRKQSGYYNEPLWGTRYEWSEMYQAWHGWNVRTGQTIPLDDHEFYRQYWRLHGDGMKNWDGPNKGWRKYCNKRLRCDGRREMHKYATLEDYEPIFKTRDQAFDWWYYD